MGAQNVYATFAGNRKFGLLSWQSHARQNYTTGEALSSHASADVTGPCNNVLCYEPRYLQLKILIKQPTPVCSLQLFSFSFFWVVWQFWVHLLLCAFSICGHEVKTAIKPVKMWCLWMVPNEQILLACRIHFFVPCTLATLEFVISSGNLCVCVVCPCQALVCALMSSP